MSTLKTGDGEAALRGKPINGADQPSSAEYVGHQKKRNTDAVLHLDGETDSLYDDGLDVDKTSRTQSSVDGKDDNT